MLYEGQDVSKLSFSFFCVLLQEKKMFMKLKYVGKCAFNLMVLLNVVERTWSLVASCIDRLKIIREE